MSRKFQTLLAFLMAFVLFGSLVTTAFADTTHNNGDVKITYLTDQLAAKVELVSGTWAKGFASFDCVSYRSTADCWGKNLTEQFELSANNPSAILAFEDVGQLVTCGQQAQIDLTWDDSQGHHTDGNFSAFPLQPCVTPTTPPASPTSTPGASPTPSPSATPKPSSTPVITTTEVVATPTDTPTPSTTPDTGNQPSPVPSATPTPATSTQCTPPNVQYNGRCIRIPDWFLKAVDNTSCANPNAISFAFTDWFKKNSEGSTFVVYNLAPVPGNPDGTNVWNDSDALDRWPSVHAKYGWNGMPVATLNEMLKNGIPWADVHTYYGEGVASIHHWVARVSEQNYPDRVIRVEGTKPVTQVTNCVADQPAPKPEQPPHVALIPPVSDEIPPQEETPSRLPGTAGQSSIAEFFWISTGLPDEIWARFVQE